VAVNDSWKLDVATFARSPKTQIDADKSEGTGTLVKVYEKDDARFGVIKLHLELHLKEVSTGDGKLVLRPGSKSTTDLTLDVCIDGSRLDGTRKGLLKVDLTGETPELSREYGKEARLTITLSGDSRQTTREVKK